MDARHKWAAGERAFVPLYGPGTVLLCTGQNDERLLYRFDLWEYNETRLEIYECLDLGKGGHALGAICCGAAWTKLEKKRSPSALCEFTFKTCDDAGLRRPPSASPQSGARLGRRGVGAPETQRAGFRKRPRRLLSGDGHSCGLALDHHHWH